MSSNLSNNQHSLCEEDMVDYLMNEFCHDPYEREEMNKWIAQKDIAFVYHVVVDLFSNRNVISL